jgi:hypothetical protein
MEGLLATLEQRLTEILDAPVVALGYELWGIEFIRAGKHWNMLGKLFRHIMFLKYTRVVRMI